MKIIRSPALRLTGLAATTAWIFALGVLAQPAWGFGFGEPIVSSALGQPLRLRIPVRVDPELELTPQCVRLLGSAGSDAIPTMNMAMARISIERKGADRILRIDSIAPINEPVLRVAVEAGCAQHTRREFVLLLDPPDALPQLAVAGPLVATAVAPAPSRAPAPAGPAATPAQADADADAGTATPTPAPAGPSDEAALVLGAASITGRMGEALSLQVPVTGSGAASLDAGCVRLAGAWNGEGAPVLSQARLAVVRTPAETQIDLLTLNPVTVPALRVVLEAGCGTTVRREYAVLLDQSAAGAETAQAGAPAGSDATGTAAVAGAARAGNAASPAPDAQAPAAPPTAPKAPRKFAQAPAVPEQLATAPPQQATSRVAAAAASSGAAARPAPPPKAKQPAPVADRLVLAAPSDQPDPAAQRLADMDKRISDLTKEVTLLRDELAADRQRAAESAENPGRLGAGWIVAILALLGLGLSGLMNWQRKRSGMPWEKSGWEPTAAAVAAAPDRARPVTPAMVPAAAPAPREAARTEERAAARPAEVPRPLPPPLPRTGPLAAFDELTGTGSTLTPGANPKTTIEVTELHADDPELEKMHTVFLEPGNLEGHAMPPLPAGPIETRIPGPRPEMPGVPPAAAAADLTPPAMQPFPPIADVRPATDLPPMPPPTILAPDQRHGAFTFDEGPYTQTPTMLVLDLDLTTRALPAEDAEIAKFAEAAKNVQVSKDSGSGMAAPAAEPRGGYKNGH